MLCVLLTLYIIKKCPAVLSVLFARIATILSTFFYMAK
jgi:hypothetical protein